MGFTYAALDAYLMGGEIPETTKKKIDAMHRRSEHKRSGIKKY